jgi:hypothetical protein
MAQMSPRVCAWLSWAKIGPCGTFSPTAAAPFFSITTERLEGVAFSVTKMLQCRSSLVGPARHLVRCSVMSGVG